MTIYHKPKTNNTFFQDITDKDEKDRLRNKIMELMKERSKAREERAKLAESKRELIKKTRESIKINQSLDFRLDKLMEQFLK